MPDLVKVAAKKDIPAGTGKVVRARDKDIALFQVQGQIYAVDNNCPHRAGPLGEGTLEGNVITCPWHGWQFDVTDGQLVRNSSVKAVCYPVKVQGEDVLVEL
jgi:nitrite reductase (NADH) small subunit